MVPERVEREILVEAPLDVVWAVVTEPEHIAGWFSDSVEIELRPGGKVTLVWEGSHTERGRVERVEPPHLFSFRWIRGSEAEVQPGNSTLVEFSLSAEDGGTRLRVIESGFTELDLPEDERARDAEQHREGWELELDQLLDHVRGLEGTTARP